jgi:hypothetical protein
MDVCRPESRIAGPGGYSFGPGELGAGAVATLSIGSSYRDNSLLMSTLAPLDMCTILESAAKTGRLIDVEESRSVCELGGEIIAAVASERLSLLKAPARRVAAPVIPIPAAAHMEAWYLPNADDITAIIRDVPAEPVSPTRKGPGTWQAVCRAR